MPSFEIWALFGVKGPDAVSNLSIDRGRGWDEPVRVCLGLLRMLGEGDSGDADPVETDDRREEETDVARVELEATLVEVAEESKDDAEESLS